MEKENKGSVISLAENSGKKELFIEKLRALVFLEACKPYKEMDAEFVVEGSEFLGELENTPKLTDDEIGHATKEVLHRYDGIHAQKSNVKHKVFKRLLIAALISILILAFSVAASGDNPYYLLKWKEEFLNLPFGEFIEFHGVDIYKPVNNEEFDSYEDYLETAEEGILYPSALPEGIEAATVSLEDSTNDGTVIDPDYLDIYFTTSNLDVGVRIHTNPNMEWKFLTNERCVIETINGFECYVITDDTPGLKYADCHFFYGDYVYYVKAETYEDLVFMVENFEVNKK